jgi:hypothetical protein
LIRRTLSRTWAPIFKSLSPMVPQLDTSIYRISGAV